MVGSRSSGTTDLQGRTRPVFGGAWRDSPEFSERTRKFPLCDGETVLSHRQEVVDRAGNSVWFKPVEQTLGLEITEQSGREAGWAMEATAASGKP